MEHERKAVDKQGSQSNASGSIAEFSRDLESQDLMIMSAIENGFIGTTEQHLPDKIIRSYKKSEETPTIMMQEVEENYLGSPDNWIDQSLIRPSRTIN